MNAGAARGHYGKPKLVNPERAMESTRNREAELLTADYRMNADRGPSVQNGELIPPSSWPSPPGEGGPHGLRGRAGRKKEECRMQNWLAVGDRAVGGRVRSRRQQRQPRRTGWIKVNRTKSDQIKPNPTKSDQKKRSGPDQGAGRWVKTGANEHRFRSRALDAGKCRPDGWEGQRL